MLSKSNHLGRLGKNALAKKKAYHKRANKPAAQPKPEPAAEDLTATIKKPVGGNANGKERVIPVNKAPRYYSADDVAVPKKTRKAGTQTPTLRKSIQPGTVLILLAGAKKGSRVVCLKQLPKSGLLLVTGPYKINGVGLKRVNPAYVIATSTKVDISNLKVRPWEAFTSRPGVLSDRLSPCCLSTARREGQRRSFQETRFLKEVWRGCLLQGHQARVSLFARSFDHMATLTPLLSVPAESSLRPRSPSRPSVLPSSQFFPTPVASTAIDTVPPTSPSGNPPTLLFSRASARSPTCPSTSLPPSACPTATSLTSCNSKRPPPLPTDFDQRIRRSRKEGT